jgi:pectinesterase
MAGAEDTGWQMIRFVLSWMALVVLAWGRCAGAESLIVAADGSGKFKTVQSAIEAAPIGGSETTTIHIKPGTYFERIEIAKEKGPIRLVGEDATKTILTFDLHAKTLGKDGQPLGTFRTASVSAHSNDFLAQDLTFANSTPRDVSQALAVAANGDRQTFTRCRFLGWQDTIYTGPGRKLFQDCYIEGGVDYIFGPGTAVFKNCELRNKRSGYITAASTTKDERFGYAFLNCRLTCDEGVGDKSVFLGRPWRDYASVMFINCEMGRHIRPAGWDNWRNPDREKTARYAEYHSTGAGAASEKRVNWSRQLSDDEAKGITVKAVLGGRDGWEAEK